jgi:hypothetical protein
MLPRVLTRVAWLALPAAVLLAVAGPARADDDVKKAVQAMRDQFKGLQGIDDKLIGPMTEEYLARALPGQLCFSVIYPQFPVARVPPEPLKARNDFVVDREAKVTHVTDADGLKKFMTANLKPVKDDAGARDAVQTWLRLSQELYQDGFFQFSIPEKEIMVSKEGDGRKVSGKAVVDPKGGNMGEISVVMVFDADGKLKNVEETAKVLPGIRPKCQATKLLDADAVVRAMAERDILVMGRMAKGYLDEQRAKATPEVQREIDRLWKQIVEEGR